MFITHGSPWIYRIYKSRGFQASYFFDVFLDVHEPIWTNVKPNSDSLTDLGALSRVN